MPQQPLAQLPLDVEWTWQEHGSCRSVDPAVFFHPQNERGSARRARDLAAKSVCAGCPVRLECADYAIRAREPYGVWGGLTEEERELIYAAIDQTTGDPRAYPRERGTGRRLAASAIEQAIAPLAVTA